MTGAVVGGMLGLMAFMMAFTIGIVISQHGDRKAMVVEEANAIGTAWLRAGFLEEPDLPVARRCCRNTPRFAWRLPPTFRCSPPQ